MASITDNGTGDYTITWDTDFANVNYSWTGTSINDTIVLSKTPFATYQLVGSITILNRTYAGSVSDEEYIGIIAIGDQ